LGLEVEAAMFTWLPTDAPFAGLDTLTDVPAGVMFWFTLTLSTPSPKLPRLSQARTRRLCPPELRFKGTEIDEVGPGVFQAALLST
jgi:hypothetical protein